MKRFFSTGLRILRNIIMWASVFMVIAWSVIFFAPKIFGYYPYVVLSGSMEPAVHVGSLAYVELTDETYEPVSDEIHAYQTKDGTMVLHRLVGMSDTGYVFKGDANDAYDAVSVLEEDIIGRYVYSIPWMGYAGAWVSNHSMDIGPVKIPAVVLFMAGAILILNVVCDIVDKAGDEEET